MLLFILHELCTLLESWQCYSHESAKIKWNEVSFDNIDILVKSWLYWLMDNVNNIQNRIDWS